VVQATNLQDSHRTQQQMSQVSQARQRANPLLSLRSGVRSHKGIRRQENQDAFGIIETENFCFYAVADGMGGHLGGARAADLAVETVCSSLVEVSTVGLDEIVCAVNNANDRIFKEGRAHASRAGMGTTLCGLLFKQTKLAIVNVGDSRAYRLRNGVLAPLTRDHTLAAELGKDEEELDIPKHERSSMSHILTKAIGHSSFVEVDCEWCKDSPQRGDVYLVCSDGLHGVLTRSQISSILQTHELQNAVDILIRCVNEQGGPDNVTVIAVEIGGEFPLLSLNERTSNEGIEEHSSETHSSEGSFLENVNHLRLHKKQAHVPAGLVIGGASRSGERKDLTKRHGFVSFLRVLVIFALGLCLTAFTFSMYQHEVLPWLTVQKVEHWYRYSVSVLANLFSLQ
jgi:PPM family protein phosphatase